MKPKKNISVSLPEETVRSLTALAGESHRSRASYIRLILIRYLRQIQENPSQKL